MSDQRRDWGIQCPYYLNDDRKRSITCEGFIQGSNVTQRYKRFADQKKQLEVFCCRHYKNCELYRMISSEKYDM